MTSANVLTRRHRFSLLFLLGLISDPDEHLLTETFLSVQYISLHFIASFLSLRLCSTIQALCSSPAPRCRGSWHHQWQDRLGSSPRVPPQSDREGGDLVRLHWCCGCTKGFWSFQTLTHLHFRDNVLLIQSDSLQWPRVLRITKNHC